jgi:hypothetical protein
MIVEVLASRSILRKRDKMLYYLSAFLKVLDILGSGEKKRLK